MPFYEICIEGELPDDWSDWFGNLTITSEQGKTTLRGQIIDQSSLYGLLIKIRDLGLPLISVRALENDPATGELPWENPRAEEGSNVLL